MENLTIHFRKGKGFNNYYVVNKNCIIKYTYRAKTCPSYNTLEVKPNTKYVNVELLHDKNIDEIIDYYTLAIYKKGIMKEKTAEKYYDKKPPLMKKDKFKSTIDYYSKLMKEDDEMYIYIPDSPDAILIKAIMKFKKQNGRLIKVEL